MTAENLKAKLLDEFNFLRADEISVEREKDALALYLIKSGKRIKAYKFPNQYALQLQSFMKDKDFSLKSQKEQRLTTEKIKDTKAAPVVLVVEDDPDQSEILKIMLKDLKYKVLHAMNGEEALTMAAENTPDLIITDLMMPKMDGTEFIKKIKRNPAYQNIPVLVLTVLSDSDKEYALLDMGVDDYCQKTMPRKILTKRIENLVSKHMQAP